MKSAKKIIIIQISLFVVLLLADLLSKHFVMKFLNEKTFGVYVLIDKVLTFKYSLNEGAGFGIFAGKQVFLIAVTLTAIILIIGLLVFFNLNKEVQKRGGTLLSLSLVMILAGGMGNLVDRIAFGHVRDFIEYTFVETLFKRRFAICNVADIELTVGVILLIIYVLFFYQTKSKTSIVADDNLDTSSGTINIPNGTVNASNSTSNTANRTSDTANGTSNTAKNNIGSCSDRTDSQDAVFDDESNIKEALKLYDEKYNVTAREEEDCNNTTDNK